MSEFWTRKPEPNPRPKLKDQAKPEPENTEPVPALIISGPGQYLDRKQHGSSSYEARFPLNTDLLLNSLIYRNAMDTYFFIYLNIEVKIWPQKVFSAIQQIKTVISTVKILWCNVGIWNYRIQSNRPAFFTALATWVIGVCLKHRDRSKRPGTDYYIKGLTSSYLA